jgi:hypothetical protein
VNEAAQEMIGVTQKFCAQMAAAQFSELPKKATDEAKRGVLPGWAARWHRNHRVRL